MVNSDHDPKIRFNSGDHICRFFGCLFCYIFYFFILFTSIYSFIPNAALPPKCINEITPEFVRVYCSGGEGLGLLLMYGGAMILGIISKRIFRLPELLGMILAGIFIRLMRDFLLPPKTLILSTELCNVSTKFHDNSSPLISFLYVLDLSTDTSMRIRYFALTVIFVRAGMNLDINVLKKNWLNITRLSVLPVMFEAIVIMIITSLTINWPWSWGAICGFVLSPISPAIIVPEMIKIQKKGLGENKGISTIALASSAIDNVVSLICFSISFSISFIMSSQPFDAEGSNKASLICKNIGIGFGYAVISIFIGVFAGLVFWVLPPTMNTSDSSNLLMELRIFMSVLCPLCIVLCSQNLQLFGTGSLGAICFAVTLGIGWRNLNLPWKIYKRYCKSDKNGTNCDNGHEACKIYNEVFSALWWFLQPILFAIVGAKIDFLTISKMNIGIPLIALFIGILTRFVSATFSLWPSMMNWKERLFFGIVCLPKATIQAAIGANALDKAEELNSIEMKHWGQIILTLAVLSILITAPLGALAIFLSSKYLLKRKSDQDDNKLNIDSTAAFNLEESQC